MSLVCPLTCTTASPGRINKQGEFVEKYFYVGAYNVTGLALLYEKAIYFCLLTPFGRISIYRNDNIRRLYWFS